VLALKADGSLWAWGENTYGQLGQGAANTSASIYVPTRIGTDNDWVSIEMAFRQAYGIKADGSLWGWGSNVNNTLNNNNTGVFTTSVPNPIQLQAGDLWVDIEIGPGWVIALRADGATCAWGSNFFRNFADGTNSSTAVDNYRVLRQHVCWLDVSTNGFNSMALRSDGTVFTCGLGFFTGQGLPLGGTSPVFRPVNLPAAAIAICQGNSHGLILLADGTVAGFGENGSGQLGNGTTTDQNVARRIPGADRWKAIASGERHSLGIQADGSLWSWGKNHYGALGLGLGTTGTQVNIFRLSPNRIGVDNDWVDVQASTIVSHGRKADGSVWNWGGNQFAALGRGTTGGNFDTPQRMGNGNSWIDVRMFYYGIGLQANGSVWFWGSNTAGTRGDGTRVEAPSIAQHK
jgi:alpha-tubulin suppressor-like RCC1 family protein